MRSRGAAAVLCLCGLTAFARAEEAVKPCAGCVEVEPVVSPPSAPTPEPEPDGPDGPDAVRRPPSPIVYPPYPAYRAPSPYPPVYRVWQRPPRVFDRLVFTLDAGPVYTYAVQRSLGGMRIDFGFGGDFVAPFTLAGRVGLEVGGTQSGLAYQRLSWGMLIAGRIGRAVRLGVEPRIGFLQVDHHDDSAANIGSAILGATLGLHGELTIVLLHPGIHADRMRAHTAGSLDLVMRAGYDWIDVDGRDASEHSFQAKLGLGYRY